MGIKETHELGEAMSIIISFIKLPSRDKLIAMESLFWVTVIRLMVWIFPFTFVQKFAQKMANLIFRKDQNPDTRISIHRINLMITMAAGYVTNANCLVQALAGYILFSRYGYITRIKIGVFNEKGLLEAHAWLEHGDTVVLGEFEKNYKTILDIDRK